MGIRSPLVRAALPPPLLLLLLRLARSGLAAEWPPHPELQRIEQREVLGAPWSLAAGRPGISALRATHIERLLKPKPVAVAVTPPHRGAARHRFIACDCWVRVGDFDCVPGL